MSILPSTNAKRIQRARRYGALTRNGAGFWQSCFTQIHPTCIPVNGRSPVEADADVASRCATTAASGCRWRRDERTDAATRFRNLSAIISWNASYPTFGNLAPRDVASRKAKARLRRRPWRRASIDSPSISTSPMRSRRVGKPPTSTQQLRQPVRDVREDHMLKTHTNLRCGFIRPSTTRWAASGWIINLMSNHPRLFVARRSEFLRSRRKSAWRQCADAGTRRRLFRRSVHGGQLSGSCQRAFRLVLIDTPHPDFLAAQRSGSSSADSPPAGHQGRLAAVDVFPSASSGNLMWDRMYSMARNRRRPRDTSSRQIRACATTFGRDVRKF